MPGYRPVNLWYPALLRSLARQDCLCCPWKQDKQVNKTSSLLWTGERVRMVAVWAKPHTGQQTASLRLFHGTALINKDIWGRIPSDIGKMARDMDTPGRGLPRPLPVSLSPPLLPLQNPHETPIIEEAEFERMVEKRGGGSVSCWSGTIS